MNPTISRKRMFATSDSPGDEGYADEEMANGNDQQKRNKSTDAVQDIALIPKNEAWEFDTAELLDSPTTIPTPNPAQLDGNNFKQYDPAKSLFLLCVVGQMTLQLDLLCSVYGSLIGSSPNMQALILTSDPKPLASALSISSISLPVVEAQGNPANHFLKLGLLHPLGGGREALDAIVIIDPTGKRRLVLPFGWGAGRHVDDPVTGVAVQRRFAELLRNGVRALERERAEGRKDFYSIAKNYF